MVKIERAPSTAVIITSAPTHNTDTNHQQIQVHELFIYTYLMFSFALGLVTKFSTALHVTAFT